MNALMKKSGVNDIAHHQRDHLSEKTPQKRAK
jgi:hypothetical protein